MKAIILAAGVGQRLGETAARRPKCLLQFDGVSLLERHVRLLVQLGISDILVVTGYRAQDIQAELDRLDIHPAVHTEFNPDFKSGSVISLWTARRFLDSGDDIILMDADVLYDAAILRALTDTGHGNCLLLDRDFEPGPEPVKICVRGNSMVEFRKQVDSRLQFDFEGESVGFFRFTPAMAAELAKQCKQYIDRGEIDAPYEEAVRDILLQSPEAFGYEDISGLAWIEIDFPEDVNRAQTQILNKI